MKALHIELDKNHPAFQWLETQADQIGAKGHIGTHIDCYTCLPQSAEYRLPVFLLDCRKGMPDSSECRSLPELKGKALILYTGNSEQYGYGNECYFETGTNLSEEAVEAILDKQPSFIIIDSHGIGRKGKEHIFLDQLCENRNCHVVENVYITQKVANELNEVEIIIDITNRSTGKPCQIYYR